MPESKPSKKAEESQTPSASGKPVTPPKPGKSSKGARPAKVAQPKKQTVGNPRWLVPTMLTLFVVGVLWVVTFYLTSGGLRLPIPPIGQWNIAVGFAFILVGFGLSTRWK
ncbi:cell division protein CrgA [Sanguibacter antarcticus]|uniref:Cell division protein CrgA n=1 Tax=Sanguibacter antarcticus TaxID=372484 RepID=A0A2A9E983_9MICO|nr:cell division protein CrgA [Sanguibacter antarcticus]PFG34750.1 uncharacterized protein UPF0233 [Sanguibacter antarcticus]